MQEVTTPILVSSTALPLTTTTMPTVTNGHCNDTTMPALMNGGDGLTTKCSSLSKKSYIHGSSSIPLLDHTIGERLRMAVEKVPDREVFIFKRDGIRKTYRHLMHDVCYYF